MPALQAFRLFFLFAAFAEALFFSGPSHRWVLDPTNAPDNGRLLNTTRLVLRVDCPECPIDAEDLNSTWAGNDASLIYDLSIFDRQADTIIWNTEEPRDSFYPPGESMGNTPFVRSTNLVGPPSLTVPCYLGEASNQATPIRVPGTVRGLGIANRNRWNITRVSYVNGLAYANGPGQDMSNISVALVYLLENGSQPIDIVWWEIQSISDFREETLDDLQLPVCLEKTLLGESCNTEWIEIEYMGMGGDVRLLSTWLLWSVCVLLVIAAACISWIAKTGWLYERLRWRQPEYELVEKECLDDSEDLDDLRSISPTSEGNLS